MTQQRWLVSTDPQELLGLLSLPFWNGVRPTWIPLIVSERKVCLFLAACRQVCFGPLSEDNQEQEVDDLTGPVSTPTGTSVGFMTALYGSGRKGRLRDPVWLKEYQCALLRCIFGNPFRAIRIDPTWLAWHDGSVRRIAEAIYDDHAFGRLPILADTLEEAGCADADLLNHCRLPGAHARGCWVVDLLLGKT